MNAPHFIAFDVPQVSLSLEEIERLIANVPAGPFEAWDACRAFFPGADKLDDYAGKDLVETGCCACEWLVKVGTLRRAGEDGDDYELADPDLWRLHWKPIFWSDPTPKEIAGWNASLAAQRARRTELLASLRERIAELRATTAGLPRTPEPPTAPLPRRTKETK